MKVPGRIAALAVGLMAVGAAPAGARDYCVKVVQAGCADSATIAEALSAARANPGKDRIFVGTHDEPPTAEPFSDEPGNPVVIVGAGAGATRLSGAPELASEPTLRLSDPDSRVEHVQVTAAGGAEGRAVQLLAGVELADASVFGELAVLGGGNATAAARAMRLRIVADGRPALLVRESTLVAEGVDLAVSGATVALHVACSATANALLEARHVTVTGAMDAAAFADCPSPMAHTATLTLANSVLPASYQTSEGAFRNADAGQITTAWSAHPDDPEDATASDRANVPDPGFVGPGDNHLRPDSPLVDAGDPAPLADEESYEDADGLVRVADGSGDGVVRRDIGAYERQPEPPPVPADNVLVNSGAEASDPLAGWSGSFEAPLFGAEEFYFARGAASSLAAGERFFAGGTTAEPTLTQRIDVAESAASIDAGGAMATVSGLLGGYRIDADEVRVDAIFRDPAGVSLGALTLAGPTREQRGNATNLLYREARGSIPPRTRAIDVVISAHRVAGGYTDGYADNLALMLSVPGVPVPGPVDPGKPVVPGLKPFGGVTVLTGRPKLSAKGTVHVGLGCESATVGRCSGTIELRAIPQGRRTAVRIARFGHFSIRPGRTKTVGVKLLLARRPAFMRHRSFRATLIAIARDGQGLQRRKTVPVRVARAAARRPS